MKSNLALQQSTTTNQGPTNVLEIIFRERLKYSALVSSAIDHGLHTPLIIIKGLAEMSLRQPDQDPRANLRKISNEADQLLKLLSNMSFVATAEPLQIQNISLRTAVDGVVIFFEKRCLHDGISLKVDVPENIRIEADPHRLNHILISLIQNAVDSFDNMSPSAPRSIVLHTQNHEGRLDLVISDTGTGIEPHIQEKVVDKILMEKSEGTSLNSYLGLALAKKMADDVGAKIRYVTEKQKGTSFTVSFPK